MFYALFLLVIVEPYAVNAANEIWTGATNTSWGTGTNWITTAPSSLDVAEFNGVFVNQPSVDAGTTVGGIWATTGVGQNMVIRGTGTLTIQSDTINGTAGLGILVDNTSAYTLTVNAPLALGATQTWTNSSANLLTVGATINTAGFGLTINGTGSTTISDVVSGTGSITQSATGTLTLSGANTFSGSTTVSGGTLTAAATSGSALGSTSSVTVNSGGTLLLGASNQINNNATITLAGGTFAKDNFNEGTASSVGMGALTLTANGSHIDFGTGTVGTLSFSSFSPASHLLAIDNWIGTAATIGSASTDRLIFDSDQSANLNDFSFTGYTGAEEIALTGGFYEIVPLSSVPEPSTWITGILILAALVYNRRKHFLRSLLNCHLLRGDRL